MNIDINKWKNINVENDYKNNILFNIAFLLSYLIFCVISIYSNIGSLLININTMKIQYLIMIMLLSSTVIALIYSCKRDLLKDFKNQSLINNIISTLSAIGISKFYLDRFISMYSKISIITIIISFLLMLAMIPCVLILFSKIYSYLFKVFKEMFKHITKKNIVILSIAFLIATIYVIVMFSKANVLYTDNARIDIVYSSDTTLLIKNNAWLNIYNQENDLRQPLFAAFSAPFTAPIYVIESLIGNIVPISIILTNTILIILIAYILSSFVEEENKKLNFFLLYLSTFAPLLFLVMLEQYSVSVFWIMLLLFMYINKLEDKKLAMIGAAGTLITTGVMFPILFNSNNRIQNKIKNLFNTIIYGLFITVLIGRVDVIVKAPKTLSELLKFTGTRLTFIDKFKQYTHFVVNCFVSINGTGNENKWHLAEINTINYVGIIIFALAILGYFVNRKEKINKICFWWVIYSYIILCVIGWGTIENSLVLYTLYFSWAFIILIYNLMKKIFTMLKIDKIFLVGIIIVSAVLLIYNVYNINLMLTFLS